MATHTPTGGTNVATAFFHATMPDLCGYGIEAYADTENAAVALLRAEYGRYKAMYGLAWSFDVAMGRFDGTVTRLTLPCAGTEGELGDVVKSWVIP